MTDETGATGAVGAGTDGAIGMVPGVRGAADVVATREALKTIPLEDPRDAIWVAWQWWVAAVGAVVIAVGAPPEGMLTKVTFVAFLALTVAAWLGGRLLWTTRPPAGPRTRIVVRVLTVGWALSAGGVLGIYYGTGQSWVGRLLIVGAVGVFLWKGWLRLRQSRVVGPVAPQWPSGTEAFAVLAVVEDARRSGIHPRRVGGVSGLDEARTRSALDTLADEGLVVGARIIAGRESSRVRATDAGRARLAEWKRALGWS